ncbi:hypothetical protein APY04_2486 [Hyphomicrobium sulfonivorans]|uniref:Uncharacterized protein n=1 Tax=Hyphomicrobium sulfonivorans TaxID=121290 RepID=A0A109BCZ5_HYPSL|nr:hypothetical protein APY04_2486 [Hyphomicrobium sulfonivorans]
MSDFRYSSARLAAPAAKVGSATEIPVRQTRTYALLPFQGA